jgi:redox-sensitive bicupin YhaK (pirin superfamily)
MIQIRRSEDRGHAEHGWLDSRHTFSFADYYDPAHMGFRVLRVINEDRVQPAKGFGTHSHRDMEILSYVLEGKLQHKDSMGTGSIIEPGDVQRMSAGTGVSHSELNASSSEAVHFLQIWILPNKDGIKPGYEQKRFSDADKRGKLLLVASRGGRDGSVTIHQDVDLFASVLEPGSEVFHTLAPNRHAWLQVTRGSVLVNGQALGAGDGAALSFESRLGVRAADDRAGNGSSEVLLFDLP